MPVAYCRVDINEIHLHRAVVLKHTTAICAVALAGHRNVNVMSRVFRKMIGTASLCS